MKYYITNTDEIYKEIKKNNKTVIIKNFYNNEWRNIGEYEKKSIREALKNKLIIRINKEKALKLLNINSKQM